jgi:hypothetical protein
MPGKGAPHLQEIRLRPAPPGRTLREEPALDAPPSLPGPASGDALAELVRAALGRLPPSWSALRDCRLPAWRGHPAARVRFALLHPAIGLALLDILPGPSTEDAAHRVLDMLQEAGMPQGWPPVVHLRMPAHSLAGLHLLLEVELRSRGTPPPPAAPGWTEHAKRLLGGQPLAPARAGHGGWPNLLSVRSLRAFWGILLGAAGAGGAMLHYLGPPPAPPLRLAAEPPPAPPILRAVAERPSPVPPPRLEEPGIPPPVVIPVQNLALWSPPPVPSLAFVDVPLPRIAWEEEKVSLELTEEPPRSKALPPLPEETGGTAVAPTVPDRLSASLPPPSTGDDAASASIAGAAVPPDPLPRDAAAETVPPAPAEPSPLPATAAIAAGDSPLPGAQAAASIPPPPPVEEAHDAPRPTAEAPDPAPAPPVLPEEAARFAQDQPAGAPQPPAAEPDAQAQQAMQRALEERDRAILDLQRRLEALERDRWEEPRPAPEPPAAPTVQPPPVQAVQPPPPQAVQPPPVQAVQPPPPQAVQPPPVQAVQPPPASPPRPATVAPATSPEMLQVLIRRGDEMMAVGDISAARRLYERAAAAGSGRAATAAGRTYDPEFLASIGARGIAGEPAVARSWYQKAAELGDEEGRARLSRLGSRP